MESVAEEILREILLKLPTMDLARSCCVCKLWHAIVSDTSFRTLHGAARHVVRAEAETLLVPEFRATGIGLEMTVLRVSSAKPMCRFTDLAGGYSPTNACNGFLLLAPAVKDWPVYVCNPVTGEKLKITAPPKIKDIDWRMYAMGSSPSTSEYKLFRLSFSRHGWHHLEVYTLGGDNNNAGWRRHPDMFPYCAGSGLYSPPPVLLDGKLYVVTERNYEAPDTILVIDVASEAHFMFDLPENFASRGARAAVHAFELRGQLCVAVHVFGHSQVCFWVMLIDDKNNGWMPRSRWEWRYTLSVQASDKYGSQPHGAWLDRRDGSLCYRLGSLVYKYDTTKKVEKKNYSLEWWDNQIQLPPSPHQDLRWNVYGGYRPSLLSPHLAFASTPFMQQHRREQEDCEQALLHALGAQRPSKKRCSTRTPGRSRDPVHGAKRTRRPAHDS
ncbi:hypothetical protein QYE76_058287 [Lolium multiflorum]|uniref:F-box domain-containing protein n=1 Tax=Lolium multiflorum TaxID=4521 RepID=A0AAD8T6V0_LOLMU|nr:hypothetical protein QYE76_058287 [Lolium multiflorum]